MRENEALWNILGASTPVIASLNVNNRELSLSGLPAGYVLSAGDYLAFDYDSGARRALHKVVDATVTANGSGVTPEFEVVPYIRPNAAVAAGVTLIKPACKAQLVFGAIEHARGRATIDEGVTFQFVQSLR